MGLGTALRAVDAFNLALDRVVRAGVQIDWQHQTLATETWFFILLLLLLFVLVVVGVFFVRAQFFLLRQARLELNRPDSELRRALDLATKTLREMMAAASRIRQQIFPSAKQPVKTLVSMENAYLIYKNFDATVKRVYVIKASELPLHFWEVEMRVESAADPVDYLDEIGFKVRDETEHALAYLPSLNDKRYKKAVIYFLPQIEPGENPRRIVVTYKWPGMFKQPVSCPGNTFTKSLHLLEDRIGGGDP